MCFIKRVYSHSQPEYSQVKFPYLGKTVDSEDLPLFKNEHIQGKNVFAQNFVKNTYPMALLTLLRSNLARNTFSISKIQEKIQECERNFEKVLFQSQESESDQQNDQQYQKQAQFKTFVDSIETPIQEQFSQNQLTNKLFGQKKYKYRLTLEGDFQEVIYKERNIKVNLSLRNLNGKIIKNSNIVNLCFALADDNGNWVALNRVGDPMLKGKTEVELYHGEAQFNKIYTKDISRTFPNGRLNIVIYAKPSILIYDGLTSEYEEHIDEESVQPLVISKVMIKAKKKY